MQMNKFRPIEFNHFDALIMNIQDLFWSAPTVHPPRWQSMDISKYEAMAHHELLNFSFTLNLNGITNLDHWRMEIKPNLPWADDHFLCERMSGEPLNPGETYKYWPPGMTSGQQHASEHLREGQQFDHSYAERYWPKFAGISEGGRLGITTGKSWEVKPRHGIRFEYGDVNDVMQLLIKERLTRQAFLPVWFPEDIAAANQGKRVPCTLGYHFIVRENKFHCVYYIRSCDYVRHFRDDVYLTLRLMFSILESVKLSMPEDEEWDYVRPGSLTMHITSFHMFKADHRRIFKHYEAHSRG